MPVRSDITENGFGLGRNPSLSDTGRRALGLATETPLIALGLIGGLVVTAGVVALAYAYSGDNVVIYQASGPDSGEFRTTAQRIGAEIGATVYPVTNAQEILAALRSHRRIKRLVFIGHGTTRSFMQPGVAGIRVGADALPLWISADSLGSELAARMAADGWIGWAGCSAASNPGESGWGVASYGPGGEASFVAHVRDAMARTPGALWGIELGGHSAPGHASGNPGARNCPVRGSEVGRQCYSVLDQQWGPNAHMQRRDEWLRVFEGLPAEAWISTGEVMV